MHNTHHEIANEIGKGSVLSYSIGYGLSIILTGIPLCLLALHAHAHHQFLSHYVIWVGVLICAVLQLMVQSVFFLHLGRRSSPTWNTAVFLFTIIVVVIIVGGTLWIMGNLNHMGDEHHIDSNH